MVKLRGSEHNREYFGVQALKDPSYYSIPNLHALEREYFVKMKNRGKVLDVGCGGGRVALYFGQRGYDVTAIDYSPEMCALTRGNAESIGVKVDVYNCDMRELPFSEGLFDYVFCVGSSLNNLPSVVDMSIAISEMSRVLKVGGEMLVACDNMYAPKNLLSLILKFVCNLSLWVGYRIIGKKYRRLNFGDIYYKPPHYNGVKGFAHLISGGNLRLMLHKAGINCEIQTKSRHLGIREFVLWQSPYIIAEGVKVDAK